jgi:hypothetical protein
MGEGGSLNPFRIFLLMDIKLLYLEQYADSSLDLSINPKNISSIQEMKGEFNRYNFTRVTMKSGEVFDVKEKALEIDYNISQL